MATPLPVSTPVASSKTTPPSSTQVDTTGANTQKPKPVSIPFVTAALDKTGLGKSLAVINEALSSDTVSSGNIAIPSSGYVRGFWLDISIVGSSSTAAVVFNSRMPWNIIKAFTVYDTGMNPIWGPVSGWDLYLYNLFGGYWFQPDPAQSPYYSAPNTAAASGGGNAAMRLWIPYEFINRDGIGSIAGQDANSALTFEVELESIAGVYSTAPTTTGSYSCRSTVEYWTQPNPTDLSGYPQETQPPDFGTMQRWSKHTENFSAAMNNEFYTLRTAATRVRNLILELRTSAGAADDADFPDPLHIRYADSPWKTVYKSILQEYMVRQYNIPASSLPVGVYALPRTADLTGHPGDELMTRYLPIAGNAPLEFGVNWAANTQLIIHVNEVSLVGNSMDRNIL